MPELKPSISKVVSIKEKPRKGLCVFEYKIREEKLTRAFDLLHTALMDMDDGKYGDAVSSAREALVEAQKEKLFSDCREIPKDFYKGFQSLLSRSDFKLMDDTYQRACSIVHKSKAKDPIRAQEIIRHIRYCIHEIERLEINESQLREIREKLVQNV